MIRLENNTTANNQQQQQHASSSQQPDSNKRNNDNDLIQISNNGNKSNDNMESEVDRLTASPGGRVQDLSEAVSRFIHDEAFAELRLALRADVKGFKAERFFEALIDKVEPRIFGESPDEFEFRKRDFATERKNAFLRYCKEPFNLEDKFREGDALYRENKFNAAYLAFTDAVFAAECRPFSHDEVPHYHEKEEEVAEGASPTPKMVPFNCVLLDLRLKQIETLSHDEQYKKTSIYSQHLIHWMTTFETQQMRGFFSSYAPEKFTLLQIYLGDAEASLGRLQKAIEGCSMAIRKFCELRNAVVLDRSIYNVRQTYYEKLFEMYEEDGIDPAEEIDAERKAAKIVVGENLEKGVSEDGRFRLNDLESALRIAKDGDVIFLEAGSYSPKKKSTGAKKKKASFEVRKAVTIVGCSTSKAVISGSLVKWGRGQLVLRRLKLEIGVDIDSDDDVYLMEGSTVIDRCVIESPVNTCIYVISDSRDVETKLDIRYCHLDGLENCRRMICFQGPRPIINVQSCYIANLHSFITVISPEEISNGVMTVIDCVLYDLQDGLKVIVHHHSSVVVHVVGCQFEMSKCEDDSPSHALSMTGGTCTVNNNLIYLSHLDAVGLSLHSLKRATIEMNLIETNPESPRAFMLGEGIVLSENVLTCLANTEVVGMRIGLKISNQYEEMNQYYVRDFSAKQCSMGIYIERKRNNDQNDPSKTAEDPQQQQQQPQSESHNLEVGLYQSHFDVCYNGLVCEDWRSKIELITSSFYDVARPVLVTKANPFRVTLTHNEFKRSPDFDCNSESGSETSNPDYSNCGGGGGGFFDADKICSKMFMYFATQENLAHRVELELKKFIQIYTEKDEKSFQEKYHLFRTTNPIE